MKIRLSLSNILKKSIKVILIQLIVNYNINFNNFIYIHINEMEYQGIFIMLYGTAAVIFTSLMVDIYPDIKEYLENYKEGAAISTTNYNEMLDKKELKDPLEVIKIYEEYKNSNAGKEELELITTFVLGAACVADFMLVYLTYGSFQGYRERVKLYKSLINEGWY